MYRLTTLFSLLVLFPFLLFSYPYKIKRTIPENIYHIDSIANLFNVNPILAMQRIDSLYSFSLENGFKNCSLAKLEAYRCKFFSETLDNKNAMKSGFASLNAISEDPDADLTWKLKSLHTICHQYVSLQNWFLAAKYLHELDEMAKQSDERYYYGCASNLLKSLMLIMQNKIDEAMAMIDSMPDILANDTTSMAAQRATYMKCRALEYRGSLNGFSGRFNDCRKNFEEIIEILNSEERNNIDDYTANTFLLATYSYLSNLCTYMDDNQSASAYYDLAIKYRQNHFRYDKSTRNLADYLNNSGRFSELDSLLIPVLNSDQTSTAILHEIDHLYKIRISSLYKRGLYIEAAPWVERFMDGTRDLFLEKGKSGMDEFQYAYEAEVAKVKMLEKNRDLYRANIRIRSLVIAFLIMLIISVWIWASYKKKQQDNIFLYDKVKEVNIAYEKLSQAMIVLPNDIENISDTRNKERITYNKVHSYLTRDNRFLDSSLSVDNVQKECGISFSTMNRHLNELMGMTFNGYLNHLRLEYACKLLTNTDKTIDVVAEESGFTTNRTFMRQFKDKYNLSPTQYRNIQNSNLQSYSS